jgi:fumarate hydratase class I
LLLLTAARALALANL